MTTRLVATDLDGTLLRSDGTVSARTAAALLAAEDAGIVVVFVTGRPLRWTRPVFPHVGGHGLAIVSNGALVWDVGSDRARMQRPMMPAVALDVLSDLGRALVGVRFAVETSEGWSCEPDYPHHPADEVLANRPLCVAPAAELVTGPLLKLLARGEDRDPDEFVAEALPVVGDRAVVTHSSFPLLEISARGVTKASTMEQVVAGLGIDGSEVVAFGDMPNDLPLLAWAGTGYAMANAHPSVLAATPLQAPPNDEDGVARVIEGLLP